MSETLPYLSYEEVKILHREDPKEYRRRTIRKLGDATSGLIYRPVVLDIHDPNDVQVSQSAYMVVDTVRAGQEISWSTMEGLPLFADDGRFWFTRHRPSKILSDADSVLSRCLWNGNPPAIEITPGVRFGLKDARLPLSEEVMRSFYEGEKYNEYYAPGFGKNYLMQDMVAVEFNF